MTEFRSIVGYSNGVTIHVTRDAGWYMLDVPELGTLSNTDDASDVHEQGASLIAACLDLPIESLAVSVISGVEFVVYALPPAQAITVDIYHS